MKYTETYRIIHLYTSLRALSIRSPDSANAVSLIKASYKRESIVLVTLALIRCYYAKNKTDLE